MRKVVLFDLDGTLVNTEEGITKCVAYALDSFDIKVENLKELCKFIGPPLHVSFQKYYDMDEASSMKAVDKYRERYKDIGIFECNPYDGIMDMLKMLKEAGVTMGVATAKPEGFAKTIVKEFGMDEYFTYVTGSCMDGTRTNKDEVIEEALKRFGLENDREKVIMVGDREHDILGAKKCNLKSIGITFGFAIGNELIEAGADYIVDTPMEIANTILNS